MTVKANFKTLGKRMGGLMKAMAGAIEAAALRLSAEYGRGAAVFNVEIEGENHALGREDLLVTTQSPADQSVVADGASWVSFDTRISEALKREGLCRELLRRLQVQRKDSGLEIEDRIHIRYSAAAEFAGLIAEFKELLCDELWPSASSPTRPPRAWPTPSTDTNCAWPSPKPNPLPKESTGNLRVPRFFCPGGPRQRRPRQAYLRLKDKKLGPPAGGILLDLPKAR